MDSEQYVAAPRYVTTTPTKQNFKEFYHYAICSNYGTEISYGGVFLNTPPQEASIRLKITNHKASFLLLLSGVYPNNIKLSDNLHSFRTTPIFPTLS